MTEERKRISKRESICTFAIQIQFFCKFMEGRCFFSSQRWVKILSMSWSASFANPAEKVIIPFNNDIFFKFISLPQRSYIVYLQRFNCVIMTTVSGNTTFSCAKQVLLIKLWSLYDSPKCTQSKMVIGC